MIPREDIDKVRERIRIEEIVGDYVNLKGAGTGSMKGLCPFHDEKTPSFHVRPHVGRWHCFGCGEGGDVFNFIERIEHISFVESVEYLARKAGVEIRNEDRPREKRGITRSRLVDAHVQAQQFFADCLAGSLKAKDFLHGRGFDDSAIADYGIGYAPDAWDELLRHLRNRGFTEQELGATGLFSTGKRGFYDRFRDRIMWPITSITGEPIGFGARIMGDGQPKYLNTPETQLYKKSQVLYGLDRAKKAIVTKRQIVVVEGYTDVMAMHLAGIDTAVATCGTAFGQEHIKVVRRLLGDTASPSAGVMLASGKAVGGEVIFTFDGDEAGKKAALRAYQEDQAFAAQTFIATDAAGRDPADIRQEDGDEGLHRLIDTREPLFAFAIRSVLAGTRLDTAEGRVQGLRAAAPMVRGIRDRVLRSEYTRQLSGWLGMDEDEVRRAVQGARPGQEPAAQTPAQLAPRHKITDPIERIERTALEVMLQQPGYVLHALQGTELPPQIFTIPLHRAIYDAVLAIGGLADYRDRVEKLISQGIEPPRAAQQAGISFVQDVCETTEPEIAKAITEISVAPIPQDSDQGAWTYVRGVIMALLRLGITRQIGELRSRIRQMNANDEGYDELFARLMRLEAEKRSYDSE